MAHMLMHPFCAGGALFRDDHLLPLVPYPLFWHQLTSPITEFIPQSWSPPSPEPSPAGGLCMSARYSLGLDVLPGSSTQDGTVCPQGGAVCPQGGTMGWMCTWLWHPGYCLTSVSKSPPPSWIWMPPGPVWLKPSLNSNHLLIYPRKRPCSHSLQNLIPRRTNPKPQHKYLFPPCPSPSPLRLHLGGP